MKCFGLFFCMIFVCAFAVADTVNITWKTDDTIYDTSICTIGGNLDVPTPPTKTGYNFVGWRVRKATELLYLSSAQFDYNYIDTGIKFDSNEIEYETKLSFCTNYKIAFGAMGTIGDSAGTTKNSSGSIISSGSFTPSFSAGNTTVSVSLNSRQVHEYVLYINKTANRLRGTVDNEVTASGTISGTITSDKNIILGSLRNENFKSFCGKIYYFRIKKDGVLVLDLIPVKNYDGIVCFYDKVSKTFLYGQYGVDFTAGPEAE